MKVSLGHNMQLDNWSYTCDTQTRTLTRTLTRTHTHAHAHHPNDTLSRTQHNCQECAIVTNKLHDCCFLLLSRMQIKQSQKQQCNQVSSSRTRQQRIKTLVTDSPSHRLSLLQVASQAKPSVNVCHNCLGLLRCLGLLGRWSCGACITIGTPHVFRQRGKLQWNLAQVAIFVFIVCMCHRL